MMFHKFSCDQVTNTSFQLVLLYNDMGKMAGKHFVNQFKNTRRMLKLQSGKKDRNAASNMKKPLAGRRPWGKAAPEKS